MITVLIPVYIKSDRENLNRSVKSIINQTIKPEEVLIVCDGKIADRVYDLISDYKKAEPELFTLVFFDENRGLGFVLRDGVLLARNNIIARMDDDDISLPERFEKQLYMITEEGFDMVGTQITEFEVDSDIKKVNRRVPCNSIEINKFLKMRNPFNHMSVMFKKQSVIKAGNYIDFKGFEDYYLWARMLKSGAKVCNLNESLVLVRTGKDFMKRRSGIKYIKTELNFQKELNNIGIIKKHQMFTNSASRILVRLIPNFLRSLIYRKLLREKV